MQYKPLGNTNLHLFPIALGGNVFGWTLNEKESFNILDAATDAGINFIDTADSYSHWVPGNEGGESESIIGKWLKQKGGRDKIIIGTKVGSEMGPGKKGLSEKYIIEEVEHSLRRLKTDYIDLYQSHHDDPETPVEETLSAYDRLIKEGKVRYIAASNFTADRLQQSEEVSKELGYPEYQSIQPEYNLYSREGFETQLASYVKSSGIGVICYFSLASGFLTGKYRSEDDLEKSVRGAGMKKYLNKRGFQILEALDQAAEQYDCSQATIAIAWLLSRPEVTAPITSATNTHQIKTLVKATEVNLSSETIALLDQASAWDKKR